MQSAFGVDHGDISKAKVPELPSFGPRHKTPSIPKMEKLGEKAANSTKRLGNRITAKGTMAGAGGTGSTGYGRVQAGNRIQSFAGRMMSNPKKTGQIITGGSIAGGTAGVAGIAGLTHRKGNQ